MDFAVSIVGSIVTEVWNWTLVPLKRHASYVLNRELNVEDLKKKVELLEGERERVKKAVEEAERNGEKIHNDVQTWLRKVDQKINDEAVADRVRDLEEKAKDRCFVGLCPNLKSYYQLGKKAEEDAKVVAELLQHGILERPVGYRPPVAEVAAALPNKGYQAFQSRATAVEGIMDALKDPNLTTVGVFGMAGVGKTMLVKEVARKATEEFLFDEVVMVTVSHDPNTRNIQEEIAVMLGLKFDVEIESGRAMRLRQRFQLSKDKNKNILVILDDIWGRLDLDSIGISFHEDNSKVATTTSIMQNKVKVRNKILLTSRSQDVLLLMNSQRDFELGLLSPEESMGLFGKIVGETVDKPDFRERAVQVVLKCAGLPVAVSVIGHALKGRSLDTWDDALQKLTRSNPINIGDMKQGVYSAIELSYKLLNNNEAQLLFQLCALHPQGSDIHVSYLQRYSLGLELLEDVDSLEDARKSVNTAVEKLKASSLLLSNDNDIRLVKMHDIIRDVSISIANNENQMFVITKEVRMKELLRRGKLDSCTAMSLPYGDFHRLPDMFECPNLKLLILFNKDSELRLPDEFFSKTTELKVLHLAGMRFASLPSSFHSITKLRTLCLTRCTLGDIAIIGQLKNLDILSFDGSEIKKLPPEIGELTQLRSLDLSNCSKLKVISANIISRLSCLEELYVGNSFDRWDVEGNASLAELKLLDGLTTLHVHIRDPSIMPSNLFSGKLERFMIFIGDKWDWSGKYEHSRTLKLELNTSIELDRGIKLILKKTEDLYLDQLNGVNNMLSQELGYGQGFPHLKKLHVQNDPDVEYIIYDDGVANTIEFSQLRSITLQGLPKLISFCLEEEGQLVFRQGQADAMLKSLPLFNHKIVFSCLEKLQLSSINVERIWQSQLSNISNYTHNLTSLIIEDCGNLRHVLSSSVARSLVNLESLEIVQCKLLREIIYAEGDIDIEEEEEEENKAPISFPQLKSLKIKNLKHLVGFCSENHKIKFPSLKLLEIQHCPKMKGFVYKLSTVDLENTQEALFDEKVAFPSLEKLVVSDLRNMKMIWDNQRLCVNSFCKLEEMAVEHCDELLTIFPFDMLGTVLPQLQTLNVVHCGSLEDIFQLRGMGLNINETQPAVVDTQLRKLYLHNLPALKNVWNKDPQGVLTFQNLSEVSIYRCWRLKNVFPASVARFLPQLEVLAMCYCGVEEIISKGDDGSEYSEANIVSFEFEQLSTLALYEVPKLKCLYPGMHTAKWPMLKRLDAYECRQAKILDTECLNLKELDNPESPTHRPFFLLEKVVPKLEEVSLNSDDIAMIFECDNKFSKGLFLKTKVLHLQCFRDCSFPTIFLERFKILEVLDVRCSYVLEVFPVETNAAGVVLPIRKLILSFLTGLEHVWKQESRLDCILPNLESLQVFCCGSLISLGTSSMSFRNLTTLDVFRCEGLVNLVPSIYAVQSLVQLKILKIRKCSALKEIVGNEGNELATSSVIILERLKCVELKHLPGLESFCSGNHAFEFPWLDQVILSHCPKMEIFCKGLLNAPMLQRVQVTEDNYKGHWYGDLNTTIQQLHTENVEYEGMEYLQLSESSKYIEIWKDNLQANLDLKNLQCLEVYDCNSLTYIFTTSMALDLVQLKQIKVKNCPMMVQIIRNDGLANEEATTSTIMLPSLGFISLESCSKLTCFYLGSNTVDCPSLTKIVVKGCPEMFSFACASASPENNGSTPPLFSDKVAFPNLTHLFIGGNGNWTKIWDDKLAMDSFRELTLLSVENCGRLLHIIPFDMMEKLDKLEALRITNCDSLGGVIGLGDHADGDGLINSRASEESKTAIPSNPIMFPKLSCLVLEKLPKLKSFFYSNSKKKMMLHTTVHWPYLKKLFVSECDSVEVLATATTMAGIPELEMQQQLIGETQLQLEISFGHSLFWATQDPFPNLEELYLYGSSIMEIWGGPQLFHKLKTLELKTIPDASLSTTLKCFIHALPNLEKLLLIDSPLKEIFPPYQGLEIDQVPAAAGALTRLSELKLFGLPELTHLWKEDFPVAQVFSDLRLLAVSECGKLHNLVPSFVSFESLTTLEVSECHGLKHLITLPTATSLVLLREMIVTNCKMIEEIIAHPSTDEVIKDNIIFSQLKSLKLCGLPRLSSFCSGNLAFDFPSLETVIVTFCPKMKIFCRGDISAPNVHKVHFAEDKERWDGNLNTTLEQISRERETIIGGFLCSILNRVS